MIKPELIKSNIKTKFIGKRIFYYENIDSTNLEAIRLIDSSKAQFGDLVVASTQTSGKGQQNHSWSSPEGGIYISIITTSKVCESTNLITFASGLACLKAIEKITGIKPTLKWVNDIIFDKKKLGGILTESFTRGNISTHITGIGINSNSKITNNINQEFHPVSLSEILETNIDSNLLIAEICNYFEKTFNLYQTNPDEIIQNWLKTSNIIGKKINFSTNNSNISGEVININKLGHLIVLTPENQEYIIISTRNVRIFYK